ncbi:hypothetical protein CR513_42762, partial [Mucuna pruriens]
MLSWVVYSLKHANLPSTSTSSITKSSLATVSTSKDAKAAKGKASENSRLVIVILLSWCLSTLRSGSFGCSVHVLWGLQSCKGEESILALDGELFPWFLWPACRWSLGRAEAEILWRCLGPAGLLGDCPTGFLESNADGSLCCSLALSALLILLMQALCMGP